MQLQSAVVLAGGEGERLRPLTRFRPKPVLPVANRPILEYVFDALIDAGVDDLHVVVGYERDRIQNYFGPTYRNRTLTYHVQGKQLGSGHALLQASDALDEDFLVVNGDQLIREEMVSDVLNAHSRDALATLAVVESARAPQYGAVKMADDRVVELVEKPMTDDYHLLNAGVYALGPSFFSRLDATPRAAGELGLPDTISRLVEDEQSVRGVRTEGFWRDATYPWDLLTLSQEVLSLGMLDVPEREDGVYVAESATVHEDAVVQAPAVVGPDAEVGPGVVVCPNTAIGQNATVEANATVKNSVVDADARVGPGATVVDAVTGQNVTVGAGTVVPGGVADVRIGQTVHSGCRLGGVFADRVTLDGGVTVTPGTLVGPNASVHAGATVSGAVSENAEVQR